MIKTEASQVKTMTPEEYKTFIEPVKQEPVAVISESAIGLVKLHSNGACLPFGTQLYSAPVSAKRERYFCERCGKRVGDNNGAWEGVHTCTPPEDTKRLK